jgi:hypothetical protein
MIAAAIPPTPPSMGASVTDRGSRTCDGPCGRWLSMTQVTSDGGHGGLPFGNARHGCLLTSQSEYSSDMADASLYLTLAQVLPTLLVVLVIELRASLDAEWRYMDSLSNRAKVDSPDPELGWDAESRAEAQQNAYWFVGLTFGIGEVASLAAPVFGVEHGSLGWVLGPIALVSALFLGLAVIFIPLAGARSLREMRRSQARIAAEDKDDP